MIKIYSWNVNGIRAVNKKGLWQPFVAKAKPDYICLQEIKANHEQIDIDTKGYEISSYPAEKPGYSGTAILSRESPVEIKRGFPDDLIKKYKVHGDVYGNPNLEGRVLASQYKDFWLVSVYTPNAKDDLSRLETKYKQWDPAFLEYMKQLGRTKPVIICGDINVARTADDLANPKANKGKKGFTDEEKEGMNKLIDAGYLDSFRLFHEGNGYYTWWSHFANARERNVGWRIDYILVDQRLKSKITDAEIHPKIFGSDHCPVSLTLDI
ncbi:MAG TPA: exodeoxyribonuclease III [Candidatus Sulfotelmatobacter sp.]|nr:exodeoxyribonuclease III [Candidatus Sulfotelmatobacter sp.]